MRGSVAEQKKLLLKEFADARIILKADLLYVKKFKEENPNHNKERIPCLSAQFFQLVAYATGSDKWEELYLLYEVIPFLYKGNFYALQYDTFDIYLLFYKSNDSEDVHRIFHIFEKVYKKVLSCQHEAISEFFFQKDANVLNHFKNDMKRISEQGNWIEVRAIENRKMFPDIFVETFFPRKSFDYLHDIKTYILGVFSFIEFVANCLLPFWEGMKSDEWNLFIQLCSRKNPAIKTWIDLYDKNKTTIKREIVTENGEVKEITRPAWINVIREVMKVIGSKRPDISKEYEDIKQSYRNVITHGEIGNRFLFELAVNRAGESPITTSKFQTMDYIGVHAFHRVKNFLNSFLDAIRQLYPIAAFFIESGHDIPVDVSSWIILCENDLSRARKFSRFLDVVEIIEQTNAYALYWSDEESGRLEYTREISKSYGFIIPSEIVTNKALQEILHEEMKRILDDLGYTKDTRWELVF